MSVSYVDHDLGRDIFVSNTKDVQLSSQAVARVCYSSSYDDALTRPEWKFLQRDIWLSRPSCFQVGFDVRFEPQLISQLRDFKRLSKLLIQSLISAELGFVVSLVDQYHQNNVSSGFHFIVRLKDTNTIHDVDNLRPPARILSHQLSSIDIRLDFALPQSEYECQISKFREEKGFVKLLDAGLRCLICRDLTRIRGISKIEQMPTTSLSTLAPSVFLPGFAECVASRIRLLEPITKLLLMFQDLASTRHSSMEHDRHPPAGRGTLEADDISAGLWMTMTNALQTGQLGRRLTPLKFDCEQSASLSDDKQVGCGLEFDSIEAGCTFAMSEHNYHCGDSLLLDRFGDVPDEDCTEVVFECAKYYTEYKRESRQTSPLTLLWEEPASESGMVTDILEGQTFDYEFTNHRLDDPGMDDSIELDELGGFTTLKSESAQSTSFLRDNGDIECGHVNASCTEGCVVGVDQPLPFTDLQAEIKQEETLFSHPYEGPTVLGSEATLRETDDCSVMMLREDEESESEPEPQLDQFLMDLPSMLD